MEARFPWTPARTALGPAVSLPAVAALEARRLDWVEVFRRATDALHRSSDAFLTVTTDPSWPPEGARIAVASDRMSSAE